MFNCVNLQEGYSASQLAYKPSTVIIVTYIIFVT